MYEYNKLEEAEAVVVNTMKFLFLIGMNGDDSAKDLIYGTDEKPSFVVFDEAHMLPELTFQYSNRGAVSIRKVSRILNKSVFNAYSLCKNSKNLKNSKLMKTLDKQRKKLMDMKIELEELYDVCKKYGEDNTNTMILLTVAMLQDKDSYEAHLYKQILNILKKIYKTYDLLEQAKISKEMSGLKKTLKKEDRRRKLEALLDEDWPYLQRKAGWIKELLSNYQQLNELNKNWRYYIALSPVELLPSIGRGTFNAKPIRETVKRCPVLFGSGTLRNYIIGQIQYFTEQSNINKPLLIEATGGGSPFDIGICQDWYGGFPNSSKLQNILGLLGIDVMWDAQNSSGKTRKEVYDGITSRSYFNKPGMLASIVPSSFSNDGPVFWVKDYFLSRLRHYAFINGDNSVDIKDFNVIEDEIWDAVSETLRRFIEGVEYQGKKYSAEDGGILILCTSYAQIEFLRELFKKKADDRFFMGKELFWWQASLSNEAESFTERFSKQARGILFGTERFWTGLDLENEECRGVIIFKLPFMSHSDTFLNIVTNAMTGGYWDASNAGSNLNKLIMSWRTFQGIGRLIRNKNDWGFLSILDERFYKGQYAETLQINLKTLYNIMEV